MESARSSRKMQVAINLAKWITQMSGVNVKVYVLEC